MGKSLLKRIKGECRVKKAYTVIERSRRGELSLQSSIGRIPQAELSLQSSIGRSPQAELSLQSSSSSKRKRSSRLWMRFDAAGTSELLECDKQTIMKRVFIPKRDLRILGPLFSHSSNILGREKAMVVNLEFIKAIVTAEEVFVLDPLDQAVLTFVDQLRQQLLLKSPSRIQESHHTDQQERHGISAETSPGQWLLDPETEEGLQCELPFEFRVLEIALEVSCTYLDSDVAALEREAYLAVDKLTKKVNSKNLDHVRSLKRNLICLLARVQKVRDELEHLLNNDQEMAELYLTRKYHQSQQLEASIASKRDSALAITTSSRLNSHRFSIVVTVAGDENDVEDLEMLLEAYFMQIDGTRNKILSSNQGKNGKDPSKGRRNKQGTKRKIELREYIEDTEHYVNLELNSRRNAMIHLQLNFTMLSFSLCIAQFLADSFQMGIPIPTDNINGVFWPFAGALVAGCLLVFLSLVGYARWKGLLGT